MNVAIYKGAATLAAFERWQETTAQNIAAASVPGFRRVTASFSGVLADASRSGQNSALGKDARSIMPKVEMKIDLRPGEIRNTGEDLDFAIQGPGFFQVQRPDGTAGYTRDGGFHANADRVLVNRKGLPVQGDGGSITLLPKGGRISLNAEGTLIQGDTPIGKIAVQDFPETTKLHTGGDGLIVPEDPNATPQRVENPGVVSGAIEGSNVMPLQEMVNLIMISRTYETSQRVITAYDENSDKAIQMLGNPNP